MSSGIGCTGSTYPPRRATSAAGAGLPHGEPAGWTWLHGPRADSSVVVSPGEPVPRPGTMATDVAWAHGRSSRRQGYCSVRRALVSQVVARVEGGTGGCLRGAGVLAWELLRPSPWRSGIRVEEYSGAFDDSKRRLCARGHLDLGTFGEVRYWMGSEPTDNDVGECGDQMGAPRRAATRTKALIEFRTSALRRTLGWTTVVVSS